MGGQPLEMDWEIVVGRDLVPHLLPAGRLRGVRRPADVAWLAHEAYPAGAEVRISFRSRTVAAAASSWLRWMLSDHGGVRAGRHRDGRCQ